MQIQLGVYIWSDMLTYKNTTYERSYTRRFELTYFENNKKKYPMGIQNHTLIKIYKSAIEYDERKTNKDE